MIAPKKARKNAREIAETCRERGRKLRRYRERTEKEARERSQCNETE